RGASRRAASSATRWLPASGAARPAAARAKRPVDPGLPLDREREPMISASRKVGARMNGRKSFSRSERASRDAGYVRVDLAELADEVPVCRNDYPGGMEIPRKCSSWLVAIRMAAPAVGGEIRAKANAPPHRGATRAP